MIHSQKIVGAVIQDLVAHGHTGGYQLGYSSLDNGFCSLGIFQLVAYSYPVTGFHQFV